MDLLTVKAEKLHEFCYFTQSNQQKKIADKQKKVIELQKKGGKPSQEVLKKCYLFISLFARLLCKLEKNPEYCCRFE